MTGPPEHLSANTGEVCTFYSYKGGVGRTFAVANVAVLLARWGYRVLCIDWDLEAPGLHMFFKPLVQGPLSDGVLELVQAQPNAHGPDWRGHLTTVGVPEAAGRLDFMPAARLDASYIDRLQKLDWTELYEVHGLGGRLETIREDWIREYDVILIDSRTGITDIGGICTVQLPDIIAFAFTPNQQSLEGALEVVRRAEVRRNELPFERPRLRALPVVTRFEASIKIAQEWVERIERTLAPVVDKWTHRSVSPGALLTHTRIPYIPHWSFGEELPVLDEGTTDPLSIGYAFETLASLVAHGLEGSDRLIANRQSYVDEARRRGETLSEGAKAFPLDAVVVWDRRDRAAVRKLVADLRERGYHIWLEGEEPAPGSPWHSLHSAAEQARSVIVAIGEASSRQVESQYAQLATVGAAQLVIPVLLTSDPNAIPPSLLTFQWIDAASNVTVAVRRIERLLLEQRVNLLLETVGPEHPATLETMAKLARTLVENEELDGARALQGRLVGAWRLVAGESDVRTLTALEDLAETLARLNDNAASRAILARVVAGRRRILGTEHPDTLEAMARLADAFAAEGDIPNAQATYGDVAATRARVLGDNHPDTQAARAAVLALSSRKERDLPPGVSFELDRFINRQLELELFAHLMSFSSPARLLLIEGPGGQGKSLLLHRFRFECMLQKPRPVPVTLVALDEFHDAFEVFRQIRSDLRAFGLDFPAFEQHEIARLTGDLSALRLASDSSTDSTIARAVTADRSQLLQPQLTSEQDVYARTAAAEGFLSDLDQILTSQPVVFLIDNNDVAPPPAKPVVDRLLSRLLDAGAAPPRLLLVVAGRRLDDLRLKTQDNEHLVFNVSSLSSFSPEDVRAILQSIGITPDGDDVEFLVAKLTEGSSISDLISLADILATMRKS